MKPSFQDKLKALKSQPATQQPSIISDKKAQRRAQERSMRQDVALNWLESLLMHYDDGIDIQQIAQMFVQHYTTDATQLLQSGASQRKLNLVVVDFLRHFLAPAPIPEELASAYVLLAKAYGFSPEERTQLRSASYNLNRHRQKCAALEDKCTKLSQEIATLKPHIEQERTRLAEAKRQLEEGASFMGRFSQEHRDALQAAQNAIDHFEIAHGAKLTEIELEHEMADTDLMMARQHLSTSESMAKSIVDTYQESLLTWIEPFGLSGDELLPGTIIPPGSYWRGSSEGQSDEQPLKTVRLSQSLWVSNIPVTQGIFTAVTGYNPSARADLQRPVEMISWFDALQFCNQLSELEGLNAVYKIGATGEVDVNWNADGYRLPTESEREIAARATDNTIYSGSDDAANVAWTLENAHNKTQRVRRRRPNGWGLYDMSGNVWEWCWDGYHEAYYATSPKQDPRGPEHFSNRVLRGGSATLPKDRARVSNRYHLPPNIRDAMVGFRVVRQVDAHVQ